MTPKFPLLAAALAGATLAVAAHAATGTSARTAIDTTDHSATAAAPVLETRAGDSAASAPAALDTATALSFVLVIR